MQAHTKGALILGGLAVTTGFVAEQYVKLATGTETMDRFGIRARALIYGSMNLVDPKVVMAVVWNETKGDPSNYQGDIDSPLGPSIGPMQVSRALAVELGFWPGNPADDVQDRADYLAQSSDEGQGMRWGCKALAHKISEASGSVLNGIGLYNGSLANPKVQGYQADAQSFLTSNYGLEIS